MTILSVWYSTQAELLTKKVNTPHTRLLPLLCCFTQHIYTSNIAVNTMASIAIAPSPTEKRLGPQKQAQVALLLLLVCIVCEIYGDPYLEKDATYQVLAKLEVCSLIVPWLTMWSGLVIYELAEKSPVAVMLSVLVILGNGMLMLFCVIKFVRQKLLERRKQKLKKQMEEEEAAAAAGGHVKSKSSSMLRTKLNSLARRFGVKTVGEESQIRDVDVTAAPSNPLYKPGLGVSKQKKKKKNGKALAAVKHKTETEMTTLSINTSTENIERPQQLGDQIESGEEELAIKYLQDVHGRRYSHNLKTNEVAWVDSEDGEDAESDAIARCPETLASTQNESTANTTMVWHVDLSTNRRYSVHPATGESQWEHEENELEILT